MKSGAENAPQQVACAGSDGVRACGREESARPRGTKQQRQQQQLLLLAQGERALHFRSRFRGDRSCARAGGRGGDFAAPKRVLLFSKLIPQLRARWREEGDFAAPKRVLLFLKLIPQLRAGAVAPRWEGEGFRSFETNSFIIEIHFFPLHCLSLSAPLLTESPADGVAPSAREPCLAGRPARAKARTKLGMPGFAL